MYLVSLRLIVAKKNPLADLGQNFIPNGYFIKSVLLQAYWKTMNFSDIKIEDYNYPLPDESIAKYPLPERGQSKLLVFKEGKISHQRFDSLPSLLPGDALLLFNETKVIQARLVFYKGTGARVEIFCLEPVAPSNDFQVAFQQPSPVVWRCLVGNARRWKTGSLRTEVALNGKRVSLFAEKKEQSGDSFLVEFSWDSDEVTFSEILENSGLTPLPPYLHREAEQMDKERYQTVYARFDGSVAAPTAGLHFTERIMRQLDERGIDTDTLILHVGAGTFKPVSSETIEGHQMHTEKIKIPQKTLYHLFSSYGKKIIPVGTTSLRSIESVFWMALRLWLKLPNFNSVKQWDAYELTVPGGFDGKKALWVLLDYLEENNLDSLEGETQMIIVPGYTFRFAQGLVTNFHQPRSTLLLLVAALIGDRWKEAYRYALDNNFRFLSYGDSCLFLP